MVPPKFMLITFEMSYNPVFNLENNKCTISPLFDLKMVVLRHLVRDLIFFFSFSAVILTHSSYISGGVHASSVPPPIFSSS